MDSRYVDSIHPDRLEDDCGAQYTAVNPDMVRENFYLDEYLLVHVVDGCRTHCPMARINLEIAGNRLHPKVVVDNLPEDALLGTDFSLFTDLIQEEACQLYETKQLCAVHTHTQHQVRLQKE